MPYVTHPLELAGRAYYNDGTYAGRVLYVVEYFTTFSDKLAAKCVIRTMDGDIKANIYVNRIYVDASLSAE